MLTRTFSCNGVTGTLERGTPLVSLMRSVYRRILCKHYPDFAQMVLAVEGKGTLTREEFEAAIALLDEDSRVIYTSLSDFLHNAAFVRTCQGTPFPWPKQGEMPTEERVIEMFGYFLTDGKEVLDEIRNQFVELSESVAPPEQQPIPPEQEATVDPNSLRLTENLNSERVISHEEL
jgi:hypothetical protein